MNVINCRRKQRKAISWLIILTKANMVEMNMQYLSFSVRKETGFIILNRPEALNALSLDMIRGIHEKLKIWEAESNIRQVYIMSNNDRAFCAGGDIRAVYEAHKRNEKNIKDYFKEEYALNTYIKHYPKPYISIINGITMGGGLGISIHGSLRIATNALTLAMPETGIGFFPDIGATYFLSRIPHNLGIYLGLTSARLNATETLYIGLIDQIIGTPPPNNHLETHQKIIEKAFQYKTVEEILETLLREPDPWAKEIYNIILKKSPMSLKLTLKALLKAKNLEFNQCMEMEYKLACYCLEHHDFIEGIRAAVIDKDQNPKWQPEKLSEVVEDFPV
jgi:enoyl-CoA hydratase